MTQRPAHPRADRPRGGLRRLASALSLAAALGLALAVPVRTTEPDGRALVERSEERIESRTERTRYRMDLIGPGGEVEQTRTLDVYFKRYPDRKVTLQKYLEPPILEGTGLMIVDTGQGPNDIWTYLPATRRLRRISGAEKSNRYLGTEFTYEDFESYRTEAYEFTWLRRDDCLDGAVCDVVEAVPATEAERRASGYAAKRYWLERGSLYPVRVDLVGDAGEVVKRLRAAAVEDAGDYPRAPELTMENLPTGRRTTLVALEREIDRPLDDYHLSKRYLRED